MSTPRSLVQRVSDARARLGEHHADAWVATAAGGAAHLVPLSFAWDGERVLLATEAASITVRNLRANRRARLALGHSRDVVMVDAVTVDEFPVGAVPSAIADRYANQADWDPRQASGEFVYLRLRPVRIQAWREADEIAGRTVMRDGGWLA